MRVRLKGINSITKKLADGTRRTYWYAWKGGPPLRGEPGTPEFIHSYNEAIATKVGDAAGHAAVGVAELSGERRIPRARGAHAARLRRARSRSSKPSSATSRWSALTDRRTRGIFRAWRDKLATQVTAAGRLCVAGARARLVMGS